MSKMRYGPRHGVTLAQTRYDYAEALDVLTLVERLKKLARFTT